MKARKPNETGAEFRDRVLNSISPSFCAAKWLNATIWLGSGHTSSCHHPPPHQIQSEDILNNPSGIHNTLHKKLMRAQMLKGQRPRECEYCWKIEDMGPSFVSDRVHKSDFYDQGDFEMIKALPWDANTPLRTLEVAFDRNCNFACSYCNAGYSTKWAQDIQKHGPYQGLKTDGSGAYQHNGSWAQKFKQDEKNPYVESFLAWWPQLSQELTEIKVTGGEPTASPHFWSWLDQIERRGVNENLLISFNSNFGFDSQLRQRLISKLNKVKRLGVYTSGEAVGGIGEYIRDGLDWTKFQDNVDFVLGLQKFERLVIMMTVSNLSLFSLVDFFNWAIERKKKYGEWFPHLSVTLLRFPSFLSPLTLPFEMRAREARRISEWMKESEVQKWLNISEKETLTRLIEYLNQVNEPHSQTSSFEGRTKDLKLFLTQYDQRRRKNFKLSMPPEFVRWIESISAPTDLSPSELISGDATQGYHSVNELNALAEEQGVDRRFK